MNRKDYRDTVLTYVEKLGEIDKLENQLVKSGEETHELKQQINHLKQEVGKLKEEIDNHKRNK
jgi:uncharacterized coiled-coil DUF342 family protein